MMQVAQYQALLNGSAQCILGGGGSGGLGGIILDQAGQPVLDQAGLAILDQSGQQAQSAPSTGSGNGIAICGPSGLGSTWTPYQVGVSTSTNTITPVAYLYIGPLLPVSAVLTLIGTQQVTQIAGTSTGNNDSLGLVGVQIPFGQALIVQWIGGDVGATAIMTVTGYQSVTYWR